MSSEKKGTGLSLKLSHSPDWAGKLTEAERIELYDRVTSMFTDCGDDEYIAAVLSQQFDTQVSSHEVSQIRYEAAQEADSQGTPELLRKWAFRYQYLTMNNVIREYMFISRSPGFMQAKTEIADELFWLQKKHSRAKLWLALNEALGRNNVPPNIVDELIEFREVAVKIKGIINKAAKARGADPTKFLQEVGPQIADAYQGECNKNRVTAATVACRILGVDLGTILPPDIDYFREYAKSLILDEKRKMGGLSRLVQTTDTFQGRRMMNEVLRGNLTLMGTTELKELAQEIENNPLFSLDQVKKLQEDVKRESKRHHRAGLRRLGKVLHMYEDLWDARKLFPPLERLEMRILGVDLPKLQAIVSTLNQLSSREEVLSYLSTAEEIYPSKPVIRRLAVRYYSRRFHEPLPKEKTTQSQLIKT